MKRGTPILLRHFKCSVCGQKMSASKEKAITAIGHIKTMYCPNCKEERDFIQYDADKVRS